MSVMSRIHMGIMGGAFEHATYGWFGGIAEPFIPPIFNFILRITRLFEFTLRTR